MADTTLDMNVLETKLRRDIRNELEPVIRIEYEGKFDIWKAKELGDLREQQTAQIEELVDKYFKKMAEEAKPPTLEELDALCNQTYLELRVKIKSSGEIKEYLIGELPAEVEQEFYRQFRSRVMERLKEVAALAQSTMDTPMEEKLKTFLETFEGAFDVLADAVVLILNWEKRHEEIDNAWCKRHLNLMRMWNIVQAQIAVNRLRDFFSQVSQSGKRMEMTIQRPSVQQLQQLLAR